MNKVITLIGMSGVGKTHRALEMAAQGWAHYSCDYEIGARILKDEIETTLGEASTITPDDISQLSRYVGKLGKGYLDFNEFKRRQENYYQAECQSLENLPDIIQRFSNDGFENLVIDTTGSYCELNNQTLYDLVGAQSEIIYIKASAEEEKAVLQRAQDYPKPMFFPPDKLEEWVEEYRVLTKANLPDDFDADAFARWIFPKLFQSRLPKYQALANN